MSSPLFQRKLPGDGAARRAELRKYTPELPFFERYEAGDREGAWAGLQGLGSQVREDPYAADGLAVAYETMARARANVETLAQRLAGMGYRFFHYMKPVSAPILRRPPKNALSQVLRMEEEVGPLPLSIRAWFAISGEVELTGVHPQLSFIRDRSSERSELEWDLVFTDPLVIYGVQDARKSVEHMDSVCFSDCGSAKAGSHDGGDPYTLMHETGSADCLVHGFLNVSEKITFVQYLRRAFDWGGFPGFAERKWARYRPAELDVLREELLSI